jgi:hypothetical protein
LVAGRNSHAQLGLSCLHNMERAAVITQTAREMAAVCRFVPAPLEADLAQR